MMDEVKYSHRLIPSNLTSQLTYTKLELSDSHQTHIDQYGGFYWIIYIYLNSKDFSELPVLYF